MNVMWNTLRSGLRPALGTIGLGAFLLSCQSSPKPPSSADHVVQYRSASGMVVELLPQSGSGLVASNIFVGAGSTREKDSNAGSSHFLEHLMFNGTTSRTQEELYAEVDRIGAYNNATTRQEYTHYMMVAPNEHLRHALEIQADMLLHSTLPPEKFEKERGIVIEELRKDQDSSHYRRQRAMAEANYTANNPYRRAVLGSATTIANLNREEVLDYYRAQYIPQNMRLLLMGDFELDDARHIVDELFPPTQGDPLTAPSQEPLRGGQRHTRYVDDESMTYSLRIPGPGADSEDLAAIRILAQVLADGENSRIGSALDRAGITPHHFGASLVHQEGLSTLEFGGEFDPGTDIDVLTRVVLAELATVALHSIRASEWAPARTSLLSDSIRHLSQLHYFAIFEGDRIWHAGASAEEPYQRAVEESYPRLAPAAQEWFGEPIVEVTGLGPQQTDSDESFDLAMAGFAPHAGAETPANLPGGGKISDDRPLATRAQPASVLTLDNGMTLLHRATVGTRMFAMHLWVRDRSAREPKGRDGIADLLHRCLPLGAGAYDRSEFDSLLRGIGAELKVTDSDWIPYDDYYTSPAFSFVRLDCVDIYWREAIRALGLMVQEPRLDQDAIVEKLGEMKRRRARDSRSSRTLGEQRYRIEILGDHPGARLVFGSDESLADMESKELQGFALDYLDPGQLVLSVVGNLDRAAVVEALNASFSHSRSDGRSPIVTPPWPLTERSRRVEFEVGGQQSTLRSGRIFAIDPDDRWALQAAVRMLSLRMQQEIREVRGLAYSLGMSVSYSADRAWVTARVGTQPQNLGEVEGLVRQFMVGPESAFTTEELAAAVNGFVGRLRMRQVTPMGQAYTLGRDQVLRGSLDASQVESRRLLEVTLEDLGRVIDRYFGDDATANARPIISVVAR